MLCTKDESTNIDEIVKTYKIQSSNTEINQTLYTIFSILVYCTDLYLLVFRDSQLPVNLSVQNTHEYQCNHYQITFNRLYGQKYNSCS